MAQRTGRLFLLFSKQQAAREMVFVWVTLTIGAFVFAILATLFTVNGFSETVSFFVPMGLVLLSLIGIHLYRFALQTRSLTTSISKRYSVRLLLDGESAIEFSAELGEESARRIRALLDGGPKNEPPRFIVRELREGDRVLWQDRS